ncbi:MAG: hypothetical protein A4E53_04485 [Pelotomaculum sp. PtaB.Bin104]|nr:MAG: hypothetical protein A4E53_04485 [Pelotomaculum sp. PtaB.Bin104]
MNKKLQNDEEKDLENIMKKKKIALYCLLATIYIAFLGFELGQYQKINYFNYGLHELLYLPFNLAIYLVPFLFLIYMFFVLQSFRRKTNKKSSNKTKFKTVLIVISLIFITYILNYQFHESNTVGVFTIVQKFQTGKKYFIQVKDCKIRCTETEFNLITVNKEYLVDYNWNSLSPNTGKLIYIEPTSK